MGNGIAHVLSLKDIAVELVDIDKAIVDKGIANISKNMDRQIKKEINFIRYSIKNGRRTSN